MKIGSISYEKIEPLNLNLDPHTYTVNIYTKLILIQTN